MPTLYEKPTKTRKAPPADALYLSELQPPDRGKRIIFDQHPEAPRGFGVKVTAAGTKVFLLRYFADGKDRLMVIGEHPTWSLAAARLEAASHRKRIDTGTDILEARREERQEPTVADAVKRYCEGPAAGLKSHGQITATLQAYFVEPLGTRKLSTIRRRDIIVLVEALATKHGRTAALLLIYIKQLFAWAEDRELIEVSPIASLKPAKVSKALVPRARGRVLDPDEIRSFWSAADACGMFALTALALKLVLVTGQRPGEVSGMRWEEIQGTTWTIPASRRGKTDTAHSVPLTATALGILEQARVELQRLGKRRPTQPSGCVFEARPGAPITTAALARAVTRFAAALGNKDVDTWGNWSTHDLRRTCRTGLAAAGVNDVVAEAVIGHGRKGIAAVYDHYAYADEKRSALEVWERRLLAIIGAEG